MTNTFTPMFKVYKSGMTDKPITIMKRDGEVWNDAAKREKYLMLGYTITEI